MITELVILVLFVVLLSGPLEIGELDLWLKKLEVKGGERRRETDLVEIWKQIARKEAREGEEEGNVEDEEKQGEVEEGLWKKMRRLKRKLSPRVTSKTLRRWKKKEKNEECCLLFCRKC